MKSILYTLLLCCCSLTVFAQTVNDIDFTDLDLEYVRIVANQDESDVYLDFGNKYNAPRFNNRLAAPDLRNVIKDKKGHEMIFSSIIDALNFMAANGFKLSQTYTIQSEKKVLQCYILEQI